MGIRKINATMPNGEEKGIEIHSAKDIPPDKGVSVIGGHPTKGVKIIDKNTKPNG